MLIASILLVLIILGLLFYALATNPKIQQLGLVTYGCALLAVCMHLSNRLVTLIK
jgi:Na+/phosphate symporter